MVWTQTPRVLMAAGVALLVLGGALVLLDVELLQEHWVRWVALGLIVLGASLTGLASLRGENTSSSS